MSEERNIQMTQGGNAGEAAAEMTEKEAFLEMRRRCLNIKPEDIGVQLDADNQVYGIVVDMKANDGDVNVVLWCCCDGMVSLFDSTGTGLYGVSQKKESVYRAGRKFVFSAGQVLHCCTKAHTYSLPHGEEMTFYLLTRKGVYKTGIVADGIRKAPKEKQFLYVLYMEVMEAITTPENK